MGMQGLARQVTTQVWTVFTPEQQAPLWESAQGRKLLPPFWACTAAVPEWAAQMRLSFLSLQQARNTYRAA